MISWSAVGSQKELLPYHLDNFGFSEGVMTLSFEYIFVRIGIWIVLGCPKHVAFYHSDRCACSKGVAQVAFR